MANTPLQMYMAAVKFLQCAAKLQPDRLTSVAVTQSYRLIEKLGKLKCDQDQATELLEKLAEEDPACPFTAAQKEAIGDVLITAEDGDHKDAAPSNRVVNKEQEHAYIFNYFPEILWSVMKSAETLKNKFKHVAHFCVENIQLRNACAKTRRLIVATVHEASNEDKDPDDCYDDFVELTEIFRQKRIDIKGPQSMGTFCEDVATFMKRYPESYPDDAPPVNCPCSKKAILARANKTCIPCRYNNAKLSKGKRKDADRRTSGASSSAVVPYTEQPHSALDMMKVIAGMVQLLKGDTKPTEIEGVLGGLKVFGKDRGSASSTPPTGDATEADESARSEAPLVGRKNTLPGCLASLKGGQSHGTPKFVYKKNVFLLECLALFLFYQSNSKHSLN